MKTVLVVVIMSVCLTVPLIRNTEAVRANQATGLRIAIRSGEIDGTNDGPKRVLFAGKSDPAQVPAKDSSKTRQAIPGKTANPVGVENLSGRLVERGKPKKKKESQ